MGIRSNGGFFSYVHDDNRDGRIERLRNDLCDEYEMLTGESIDIFFDRDSLSWGDSWKAVIGSSVDSAMFFIPVLTPRYFSSPACRTELTQFLAKADNDISFHDLVLPILYVNVRDDDPSKNDMLERRVFDYQYEDWTDLRFAEPESERYRRAVSRLASRIIDADARIGETIAHAASQSVSDDQETSPASAQPVDAGEAGDGDAGEEAPYLVDSVCGFQNSSDRLTVVLKEATSTVARIGEAIDRENPSVSNASRQGNARALQPIMQRLAQRLQPLADDFERESDEVVAITSDMDQEARGIIRACELLPHEEAPEKFVSSLKELCERTRTTKEKVEGFIASTHSLTVLSRALSKPLRSIERSAAKCISAFEIILSWEELLKDSQPKG